MIERQLRGRGIRNEAVLAAMARIPRERFVPEHVEAAAYADEALPIESGQTISQPYIVARMTELLDPRPGMRVLEVGTGSGYQAAVLAALGCELVTIERHESLADAARARLDGILAELEIPNHVTVVAGDGSLGYPALAPYDGIVVTAAAPRVSGAMLDQLDDGGRLVIPVGSRHQQELTLVVRHGDRLDQRAAGACVFVPLVGAGGFQA